MAADNNVEQSELARREFKKPESFARREAGALALVASLAIFIAIGSKENNVAASSSDSVGAGRVIPPPSVGAPLTYEELASEEPPQITNNQESQGNIFDEALSNTSLENRDLAIWEIEEEREKFNQEDYQNKEDYKQMMEALEKYGEYIRFQAEDKGLDPWLFVGDMYVESRGDEEAVSVADAVGLFQIRDDVARLHGYDTDDRFDPYVNVEIAAVHMQYLENLFGNRDIALWAFHAGQGNVMRALEFYCEEKFGRDRGEYTETNGNKPGDYEQSLGMKKPDRRLEIEADIREYAKDISIYDLLNSESVKTNVIEARQLADDTTFYVRRVKAAAEYYGDSN
jgi:hypothetical protein